MNPLSAIYGFSVSRNYRFGIGSKKFRLGRRGVRALELLAKIAERTADPNDGPWLLRRRHLIREIEQISPRAPLTLVIDRTGDERLRVLAIWLRGRCGGTLGVSAVAHFSTSSSRVLRKEVARCLKRLSAWADLRKMAETDAAPQIRRLATQWPSQPYASRLATSSRHFSRRLVRFRRSQLFMSPDLDLTQGHPPKHRQLIREILQRIRQLVAKSTP